MTRALIVVTLIGLAACTAPQITVMKNPKTGDVAQCRAGGGFSPFPIIQTMMDASAAQHCADAYAASGWVQAN